MKQLVLSSILFLVAFGAFGQGTPAVLTPDSPTPADVITARFTVQPCANRVVSTVVNGSLVTTTVTMIDCILITAPPVEETATFGPLPAGVYTYEIYVRFDTDPPALRSRQQFAVAPPPVPALSALGYAALAAALALIGSVVMRR